ncbi:REP-associated tyrosine transposase [Zobellella taiwanensis]|jgi:REP element-mobilizing transposase RayT
MRQGEHSRGYLPHLEGAEYQAITYRLADSLPKETTTQILTENSKCKRKLLVEHELGKGHGECWLRLPPIAAMVVQNWRFFDGKRYRLIAYIVMPNHVHLLIRVYPQAQLSTIVHGWKSYSAKAIQAYIRHTQGEETVPKRIWQPEYWDRYIRNQEHFDRVVEYIHQNPVKAGLVSQASNWAWSSIHHQKPEP